MSAKRIIELFKETFSDWSEDKASRLAAALAYYAVISLAPLLILLISIAGFALGKEAAQGRISAQIQGLIGQQSAQAIEGIIANANKPTTGVLASVAAIITLILGASGVFGALQDGLNTIWEVEPRPGRGIIGIIKDRFLSLTMVLGVGFLLMVSLVVSAALTALGDLMGGLLPLPAFVLQALNLIVSFAVITLLFALIYKFLPDVEIRWKDVWIGAAITSLLFSIGKFLIGLYLGRSSVGSAYGAAGSLVVILIWVYYSAQILFFGAEVTQVYADTFGSRIKPDKDAKLVTQRKRAQQGEADKKQNSSARKGGSKQS